MRIVDRYRVCKNSSTETAHGEIRNDSSSNVYDKRMVLSISTKRVMHMGAEINAPQISSTVRNEIRELFENNSSISLRDVESEKGANQAAVWNILRKE